MKNGTWITAPIKELYQDLYDGPHATPKPSDSGPIFLGIKNVTDDGRLDLSDIRHIAEEDFARWTRRVEPRQGDLVFTYEATLNRYAIIPDGFRGCLGRRMALIRPDTSKLDVRFLLYYFFTTEWRSVIANKMMSGATVDRIPLITFPDFPVRVPPLPVQKRIAAILSAYDELIENCQRRIKILEQMARGLYREWFMSFRFPNHTETPMVDSPTGKIPKGWEIVKFGDIYQTGSGGTPSRKVPQYFGGDINWVKTQELQDCFIFETEEKITEQGHQNSSAKLFPAKTVLVAMYGATIGQLGILAQQSTTNQACCAVLPKSSDFGHSYAYLTLLLRRPDLISLRQGAAQQNINQVVIRNFEILKPKAEVMRSFNAFVDPVLEMIQDMQKQVQNLRKTRDLLLPRLMSGQVNVN